MRFLMTTSLALSVCIAACGAPRQADELEPNVDALSLGYLDVAVSTTRQGTVSWDNALTVHDWLTSEAVADSTSVLEWTGSANLAASTTLPDAGTGTPPDAGTVEGVAFSTAPGRAIPDTLYGVTTESVSNLSALVSSVSRHQRTVTTRIVFQGGTSAGSYDAAVNQLRGVGYVMGEILDSTAFAELSVNEYRSRATSFVSRFTHHVDIWEIGNELNGEWLGNPSDINDKVQSAYDVVEKDFASLNLRSAITLNYWPSSDCYAHPWEGTETFARNMPEEIRNGVDYLFLSFYETACSPRAYPTLAEVTAMFQSLGSIFPNAKLGFGEIGAQGKDDGLPSNPTLAEKQRIARTYMGMHGDLKSAVGPRYVGGYFWWYYYQDAVPYDKGGTMWPTLEANFNTY